MLAAIYGLQALVFIMRMRWDMVAWMICMLKQFHSSPHSLHSCDPRLFLLLAAILFLEDGRLQLGFYASRHE